MERVISRIGRGALAALSLFFAAAPVLGQTPDEQRIREIVEKILEEKKLEGETSFRAFWKDGLNFETADGDFKMRLGGRLQVDFAFIAEDEDIKTTIGNQENGAEIRRARLGFAGTFLERYEFKLEFDFATGDAVLRDGYVGIQEIPVLGSLRVGHMKEPFGLEQLTSARFTTFLERGLPDAFAPSYNTGVGLGNTFFGDRATWAVGAFRDSDDSGRSQDDGGYSFTGRLTGLPWANEANDRLLHLGIAYRAGDPLEDEVRFRSRPELNLADRYVDTGTFGADNDRRLGLEAAVVAGPFSVQGEYVHTVVDAAGGNPEFSGWYAYASAFLTGEHRAYLRSKACFDRVKPKERFLDGKGGMGAWEIAARYSGIDLDDESIAGGELHDITGGVNWYPTSNTRVMFNYIFADLDEVGDSQTAAVRFQVDF
jgi:phosphate-selective porin OprO/OprP